MDGLKLLNGLLQSNLIGDLIKIIHDYNVDDGVRCHKCKLPVSLDTDCIQCEWIISWDNTGTK